MEHSQCPRDTRMSQQGKSSDSGLPSHGLTAQPLPEPDIPPSVPQAQPSPSLHSLGSTGPGRQCSRSGHIPTTLPPSPLRLHFTPGELKGLRGQARGSQFHAWGTTQIAEMLNTQGCLAFWEVTCPSERHPSSKAKTTSCPSEPRGPGKW